MSITLLDVIVIGIILISAILAMVRGFVREVLSIASWLIAAVAAYYLYMPLRDAIQPYVDNETLATIIAVAVIFIVILVVVTYITMKIADLVVDSRVGSLDRVFGFVFGAARGLLLVVVAFGFFVWLIEDQPSWISDAETYPTLVNLSEQLAKVLPDDIEAELVARLHGEPSPTNATQSTSGVSGAASPGAASAAGASAAAGDSTAAANPDRDRLEQLIIANTPAEGGAAPAEGGAAPAASP
jgi:membrane protein required for colicin V production